MITKCPECKVDLVKTRGENCPNVGCLKCGFEIVYTIPEQVMVDKSLIYEVLNERSDGCVIKDEYADQLKALIGWED